ncbi:MAG: ABC transporter ATP-binding protein [Actinomycetota bacterium]|nr:ABC transporter ATP-binding protein [Actinomycetota bacterium]
MSPAPAIEVKGLRKSYGAFEAVRGVDLVVPVGGVFALLGPNGAGKTTTVEILEGYRSRSAGEVEVLGIDPAEGGTALRSRIGIVLQECAIDPYLTVREVLAQRAAYYPAPRPVSEVVGLVGLDAEVRKRVKVLSGGQQRRLDLALALVGDPELIFLDEPTTGFDPGARRAAWEVISSLGALGKTILLTTHYMDEAQHLADSVAVLSAGRVVALGPPGSLGGRDRAAHQVRFSLPGPLGAQLPQLDPPARRGDREGEVLVMTTNPTATLHALTGWALGRGVELEGLEVTRPTLEDVYLELTADPDPVGAPRAAAAGATSRGPAGSGRAVRIPRRPRR